MAAVLGDRDPFGRDLLDIDVRSSDSWVASRARFLGFTWALRLHDAS